MDVTQLLSPDVTDDLGPDRMVTAAVVIVETITPTGTGLRFYTAGCTTWKAAGMVASIHRRIQHHDLDEWLTDEDDL